MKGSDPCLMLREVLICGVIFYSTFLSAQPGFNCTYDPAREYFQIRDLSNNRELFINIDETPAWLSGKGYTIGGKTRHTTHIKPNVQVKTQPNGFDIEYVFKNNTPDTASPGELHFGRLKLDSIVYSRNALYTFQEEKFHSRKNIQFVSGGRVYPSFSAYAPVSVFRDDDYVFGISVVYPFMEYKHTVNLLLAGANMDFQPQGWDVFIQMNKNHNGEKYYSTGEIAPGQTRIYKVFIRVEHSVNAEEDWKKVLQPYKEYFRQNYPDLDYKLNRRAVLGYHAVSDHIVNDQNPYGYWNVNNDPLMTSHPFRPDKYGFKPMTGYLMKFLNKYSFKRLMYWAPTGLYQQNPQLNYPFQFMSQWFAKSREGINKGIDLRADGVKQFGALAARGYELGFWWGHAIFVSDYWDRPDYEMFDPHRKKHWDLSFREIDIATNAGATCVGLDSFNGLTGWDQVTWLDSMISHTNHDIKFVSETYSFDVIHTKAAFFYAEWNVTGPHILADYLVPGNEKWMQINMEKHDAKFAKKWARNGYALCVMGYLGGPKYPKFKAKKT